MFLVNPTAGTLLEVMPSDLNNAGSSRREPDGGLLVEVIQSSSELLSNVWLLFPFEISSGNLSLYTKLIKILGQLG